jgi:hypothetical protein
MGIATEHKRQPYSRSHPQTASWRKHAYAMKLSTCCESITHYTAGAVLPPLETPNKRLEDADLRNLINEGE